MLSENNYYLPIENKKLEDIEVMQMKKTNELLKLNIKRILKKVNPNKNFIFTTNNQLISY